MMSNIVFLTKPWPLVFLSLSRPLAAVRSLVRTQAGHTWSFVHVYESSMEIVVVVHLTTLPLLGVGQSCSAKSIFGESVFILTSSSRYQFQTTSLHLYDFFFPSSLSSFSQLFSPSIFFPLSYFSHERKKVHYISWCLLERATNLESSSLDWNVNSLMIYL